MTAAVWSVFSQTARALGKAEKARNANRSPCKTGLGTADPAHAQGVALEDCLRAVAQAGLGSSSASSEQLADVPEDGAPEPWLPCVPLAAPGRGLLRMFSRGRFVQPGHLDRRVGHRVPAPRRPARGNVSPSGHTAAGLAAAPRAAYR